MKTSDLLKRVHELALPKATELNLTIWDVDFEKEGSIYVLTIYLDSENEVSITDCENVSRFIDPLLDAKEFDRLPSYTLCVSSAGLERKLTKDEHFEKSMGKLINVGFYKAINGTKSLEGALEGFDSENIKIKIGETTEIIKKSDISAVRLLYVD